MRSGTGPAVTPQPGRLYRTGNASLVFVLAVDTGGDAKAVVLEGGHGQPGMHGSVSGSAYNVAATGVYQGSQPSSRLLGMALEAEIATPKDLLPCSVAASECGFEWLFDPEMPMRFVRPITGRAFYQTLNASLVFVAAHPDPDGEFKTIVLRGGHGIEELGGAAQSELYFVDSVGTFCVGSVKAKECAATKLGAASGMSLDRELAVVGRDFLVALPAYGPSSG